MSYKINNIKRLSLGKQFGLLAIIILIATLAYLLYAGREKARLNQEVIPASSNPTINNEATTTNPNANEVAPPSNPKTPSTSSGSISNSDGGPVKPYGTFVSNHRPSLSGANGVPSSLESVCLGTPGATCSIVFTKGDKTKSLPEKTIGADGSAHWNWDVKEAGFTTGSWQIKAVTILNGKTAEAGDSLPLEVQP